MTTPRRTRVVKVARVPTWIQDPIDQREWNGKFIRILKRDHASSDAAISAILKDEPISQLCATKIRSYVDKDISDWLYKQRKARGNKTRKRLEIAIEGLRESVSLCKETGKTEFLTPLVKLADELSRALERCDQAFATKRHGRDRDHALLLECHSFLQVELGRPVTYATLANLVNAGYEMEGNPPTDPVDEEQVRKSLANFKKNNPFWPLYSPQF